MPGGVHERQRLATSGARAVEGFTIDGRQFLAVAQMALDVDGGPIGMNQGDSDTDVIIFERHGDHYEPFASLPAPGGEDVEFLTVDGRPMLATASIRSGAGPYRYDVDSVIYEWNRDAQLFEPFQSWRTNAAKQWRHWRVGERLFLAMAQGVDGPPAPGGHGASFIAEWKNGRFCELQTVPSRWGYNWHPFTVDELVLVAYADHLEPSLLLRWTGDSYEPFQTLFDSGGRAFESFSTPAGCFLVCAAIDSPAKLMRWDGSAFTTVQTLEGLGARELASFELRGRRFVILVNFIEGTPAAPKTDLVSQVYELVDSELCTVAEFSTEGGTDVTIVDVDDGAGVATFAVTHSLTPDLRFTNRTVVYDFAPEAASDAR